MAKKRAAKKLTPKQEAFVQEYLIDLNATQAAIRARYSEKTAYSQGQRLLKNVEIQKAIQKGVKKREKRTEITQDMVIKELAKIGFSNVDDFVTIQDNGVPLIDFTETGRGKLAAVSEITQDTYFEGRGDDAEEVKRTKFKLYDKVRSLQLIGKHLGMFNKVEVEGNLTLTHEQMLDELDEGDE